jgi:transcriptional regulator with XRE-family HTH domain
LTKIQEKVIFSSRGGEIMTLGERIRRERLRYGMSQAELSRRVQISTTAMNDIEQGKTKDPGFRKMCRIAKALGISLTVFAGEER